MSRTKICKCMVRGEVLRVCRKKTSSFTKLIHQHIILQHKVTKFSVHFKSWYDFFVLCWASNNNFQTSQNTLTTFRHLKIHVFCPHFQVMGGIFCEWYQNDDKNRFFREFDCCFQLLEEKTLSFFCNNLLVIKKISTHGHVVNCCVLLSVMPSVYQI